MACPAVGDALLALTLGQLDPLLGRDERRSLRSQVTGQPGQRQERGAISDGMPYNVIHLLFPLLLIAECCHCRLLTYWGLHAVAKGSALVQMSSQDYALLICCSLVI